MERTTVYFDESMKRRLKEVASAEGVSEASVLREAVNRYLDQREMPKLRPVGRSRDGGVARRVDQVLKKRGFCTR